MKVKRTEQVWVSGNDDTHNISHPSKNLYNEANYRVRQELFKNRRWIRYNELNGLMKESENHRSLPARTSQQILMLLDGSWLSFFKSMKEWKKNPDKFLSRPKPPGYKEKDGEHILVFTNQQCRVRDGTLKFPKAVGLKVKTRLENVDLREVRIVPQGVGYMVEIVYEKEIIDTMRAEASRALAIDLGVSNHRERHRRTADCGQGRGCKIHKPVL